MIAIYLLLIFICIVVTALIFYYESYNILSVLKIKMDNAEDKIKEDLNNKYDKMNELVNLLKKGNLKKDYLKGFNELKNQKLNNYELDSKLNEYYDTIENLLNDNKKICNNETNNLINDIYDINEDILANKKFFNKNDNKLIKSLKGYHKIVAKLNNIKVKNLYDIKTNQKD